MLNGVALLAFALHLGGMVFFAAVVAPLVFTRLPPEHAGPFIRQIFPIYYLWVGATAAVAAIAILLSRPIEAAVLVASAAITAWLRQVLMPRINRASDAVQAGDASAKAVFDRGHRLSVIINLVQLVAAAVVLVRFG